VDGVAMSFAGLPGSSSVLSRPSFNTKTEAFSNFSNLDDLKTQFQGRTLENSAMDLLKGGWTLVDGDWKSKTVFEKMVGKDKYFAIWEPANQDHSTDRKPTYHWKLTRGKIRAYGDNVRRVSDAPNFKDK
jgi:hypothetical protein